jgi:hypothetical protein
MDQKHQYAQLNRYESKKKIVLKHMCPIWRSFSQQATARFRIPEQSYGSNECAKRWKDWHVRTDFI